MAAPTRHPYCDMPRPYAQLFGFEQLDPTGIDDNIERRAAKTQQNCSIGDRTNIVYRIGQPEHHDSAITDKPDTQSHVQRCPKTVRQEWNAESVHQRRLNHLKLYTSNERECRNGPFWMPAGKAIGQRCRKHRKRKSGGYA
jgi:hypothetical protein